MSGKKRFIAGAVCPRCSAMDTIQTYRAEEKEFRECVACGFKDEMRFKPVPRELPTRVTPQAEQGAQVVKVIELAPRRPRDEPSES